MGRDNEMKNTSWTGFGFSMEADVRQGESEHSTS